MFCALDLAKKFQVDIMTATLGAEVSHLDFLRRGLFQDKKEKKNSFGFEDNTGLASSVVSSWVHRWHQ